MADDERFPWGGEVCGGDPGSPVAVATMGSRPAVPADLAAAWGPLQTENIGIETLVANVLSRPRIRFLVLFGDDVRGHLSGASLIALHRNGVDESRRIVGAPGAVPFIENLANDAIERFRRQVEVVDLLGTTDTRRLEEALRSCRARDPGPMDGPFAVVRLRRSGEGAGVVGGVGLHATVTVDPYGLVSPAGGARPC